MADMTEAAGLYWKDMDVLEQARTQLLGYLSEVGEALTTKVDELWHAGKKTSALGPHHAWANQATPGWWEFAIDNDTNVCVLVNSPEHPENEDHRYYTICIDCKQIRQKVLLKRHPNALKKLSELTATAKFTTVNGDPHRLTQDLIPVRTTDSDRLATELAEAVYERLLVTLAFDAWLKEKKAGR